MAVPIFVDGPKIGFGRSFPNPTIVVGIQWSCATAGAAYIRIMRATAGSGGPFTMVAGGLSASVGSGTWNSPLDPGPVSSYATIESWYRLDALAADATTILASSVVVHFVPPS